MISTCGSSLSAAHIRLQNSHRGAHSFFIPNAAVSRIDGGSLSTCGSRNRAAHIPLHNVQGFHGFLSSAWQGWCFEKIQDHAGATTIWIRWVEVLGLAFCCDSGLSRRNSPLDPWC
eukprot:4032201-Pyramimonas_sp.AAC.1